MHARGLAGLFTLSSGGLLPRAKIGPSVCSAHTPGKETPPGGETNRAAPPLRRESRSPQEAKPRAAGKPVGISFPGRMEVRAGYRSASGRDPRCQRFIGCSCVFPSCLGHDLLFGGAARRNRGVFLVRTGSIPRRPLRLPRFPRRHGATEVMRYLPRFSYGMDLTFYESVDILCEGSGRSAPSGTRFPWKSNQTGDRS